MLRFILFHFLLSGMPMFVLPAMLSWKRKNGPINITKEDDMGWFVGAVIVAIVCSWKLRGKSVPATKFKKLDSDESTQHKKTDDFVGNSVGAFFFMEEFADPDTKNLKPGELAYLRR